MTAMWRGSWVAVLALVVACFGCNPSEPANGDHDDHEQEEHEGEHVHGPNGGEVVELGDKYRAEWLFEGDSEIIVRIFAKDLKTPMPVAENAVTVEVVPEGDATPKTYTLTAIEPMDGEASAFDIDSAELGVYINSVLDTKTTAELVVAGDGETYRGMLVPHH